MKKQDESGSYLTYYGRVEPLPIDEITQMVKFTIKINLCWSVCVSLYYNLDSWNAVLVQL